MFCNLGERWWTSVHGSGSGETSEIGNPLLIIAKSEVLGITEYFVPGAFLNNHVHAMASVFCLWNTRWKKTEFFPILYFNFACRSPLFHANASPSSNDTTAYFLSKEKMKREIWVNILVPFICLEKKTYKVWKRHKTTIIIFPMKFEKNWDEETWFASLEDFLL